MTAQIKISDISGKDAGSLDLPGVLDVTPRRDVLHSVVVWQLANRRQWTAHTKTRSERRGGGAKPWRQKGTGRARAGTRNSPLWRGGGVTFGPRTKSNQNAKLPKKVRTLGLRMALADRISGDALRVVKELQFETANAKQAKSVVDAFAGRRTLVVVGDGRQAKGVASSTEKSFRNLKNVKVLQAEGLNVYDILQSDFVLVAEQAMDKVLTRLGAEVAS